MNLSMVLIAAGMTAMVGTALTRMLADTSKRQKAITMQNDLELVRMQIQKEVDCSATLSAIPKDCAAGDLIEVLSGKAGAKPLVKKGDPATRFDKIVLRAECLGSERGFVLKHAWMKPGTSAVSQDAVDYYSDPQMPSTKLNWEHPKSNLYSSRLPLCPVEDSADFEARQSAANYSCYVSHLCPSGTIPGFEGKAVPKTYGNPSDERDLLVTYGSGDYGKKIVCNPLPWASHAALTPMCRDGYVFSGPVSYRSEVRYGPKGSASAVQVLDTVLCCRP